MNKFECLRRDLTRDQVAEFLTYCQSSGVLTWAKDRRGSVRAGSVAGVKRRDGYIAVRVLNQQHRAHRLAWLLVTGEWPQQHIDHINGRRDDNRFLNLREADFALNSQNLKTARASSRSGLLGATWHAARSEWRSSIMRGGVRVSLGSFATAEQAHAAYMAEKKRRGEVLTP